MMEHQTGRDVFAIYFEGYVVIVSRYGVIDLHDAVLYLSVKVGTEYIYESLLCLYRIGKIYIILKTWIYIDIFGAVIAIDKIVFCVAERSSFFVDTVICIIKRIYDQTVRIVVEIVEPPLANNSVLWIGIPTGYLRLFRGEVATGVLVHIVEDQRIQFTFTWRTVYLF